MDGTETTAAETEPKWKPIPAMARRVLGVLVEKAKTTPNNYPLSLNGVTTGCNQKSNRDPHMELSTEDAEDTLEQLREWGAVGEVHGDGRVVKYRHYMKEWLGVDGTELAVMAELMLRGAQTVGELRGRAARMAPAQLTDVSSLKPVLAALVEKNLVLELTPAGRGQVVSHALYPAAELAQVRLDVGSADSVRDHGAPTSSESARPPAHAVVPTSTAAAGSDWREEVAQLREEVARLRKEIEDIWSNLGQ